MSFVECLGISQEDTMEGPLWRETLVRTLGRMMGRNVLMGRVTAEVAGRKAPASTP